MNTKYYPLFALFAAILLLSIFILLLIFGLRPRSVTKETDVSPSITYSPAEEKKIIQNTSFTVLPDPAIMLLANKSQTFTINVSGVLNTSALQIRLSEKAFGADSEVEKTEIIVDQPTQKRLTLSTNFLLLPNTYYILSIIQKRTGTPIYTATYQTNALQPTPVPLTNNEQKTLSAYLPRETPSYTLTYNKSRNVYVFHFIFQSSVPGSLSVQFDQAKNEAITFIKSIGVDPDSITIEWKHS